MHIDLLTPSLSTMERLRPRLNVQSVVGNGALLLWLRRRGVTLLATTPPRRTGCPFPHGERFVSFRVSYRGHTEVWESVSPTRGASNVEERTVNRLSSIAPEG